MQPAESEAHCLLSPSKAGTSLLNKPFSLCIWLILDHFNYILVALALGRRLSFWLRDQEWNCKIIFNYNISPIDDEWYSRKKTKPEHDNLVLTCNLNRCHLWTLRLNNNGMPYYYFPIFSGEEFPWTGADDNLKKHFCTDWCLKCSIS